MCRVLAWTDTFLKIAATDDVDASDSIEAHGSYCSAELPGSLVTVTPQGEASGEHSC